MNPFFSAHARVDLGPVFPIRWAVFAVVPPCPPGSRWKAMTTAFLVDKKGPMMFRDLPGRLVAPVPLPIFQPLARRIVRKAVRSRPELFRRLGVHKSKRYLIDPINMPFVFLLCPDPDRPSLRLYRRSAAPEYDARIAGTFLTLLEMVDGKTDGDALFFSRDLSIEGDTEAVVVLRNALDDLEGRITDDLAAFFGPPGRMALSVLRKISSARGKLRHAPF